MEKEKLERLQEKTSSLEKIRQKMFFVKKEEKSAELKASRDGAEEERARRQTVFH